jgi:hypothetical protein
MTVGTGTLGRLPNETRAMGSCLSGLETPLVFLSRQDDAGSRLHGGHYPAHCSTRTFDEIHVAAINNGATI